MRKIRLALCQINPIVGDIDGNVSKILSFTEKAVKEKVDIIVFPELILTGYTPEDLLFYPSFIKKANEALNKLIENVKDFVMILGLPVKEEDLYNSAVILAEQKVIDTYHKIYLPNYSVFDEMRYFKSGKRAPVYEYSGVLFGVNICEDIFHPTLPSPIQASSGAELIINISASPFYAGKFEKKLRMLSTRAYDMGVFIVYLNTVGGQDEIVFDGRSMVISPSGEIITMGKAFEEDFIVVDLDLEEVTRVRMREPKIRWESEFERAETIKIPLERKKFLSAQPLQSSAFSLQPLSEEQEIFQALATGLRDYVEKNGFSKVCLGLSGGIDSSFVALVATEALGSDRVTGVFMPSRYTSRESREDVYELVRNLGIELIEISIDEIFEEYLKRLASTFKGLPEDVTEENIQSRIRGNILMAISNKFGWLVITTGNKSEMAVGYATLYGDMAGGFAVIKDVYKTQIYKVAKWASRGRIPERVFKKPPSAELRPGQTDQDTLPAYEVLDEILKRHIEKCMGGEEIVEQGFDRDTVRKVLKMVKKAEFKRRQAPPGIKISPVSLGKDWRFPITNKFGG
ncbi:NAD+ synthase [Thermodesulfovibrio yellowstonii]|uniref:NAD+ synthase n=1 Tax=Thermodesulfovibrio yellowstonii TaxID=28262 RepID=UPI0024B39FB9|nr:NAD+ synthase [Thermodesulfovibrio yellowstonii]MDI6865105.1 NAD+ synthase [Thermodesulfovibrio yellowstonii]